MDLATELLEVEAMVVAMVADHMMVKVELIVARHAILMVVTSVVAVMASKTVGNLNAMLIDALTIGSLSLPVIIPIRTPLLLQLR